MGVAAAGLQFVPRASRVGGRAFPLATPCTRPCMAHSRRPLTVARSSARVIDACRAEAVAARARYLLRGAHCIHAFACFPRRRRSRSR